MADLSDITTDELIEELEGRGVVNSQHTVQIRLADFSMKHTLRCHPNLFDCSIHKKLEQTFMDNGGMSPWKPGTYNVVMDPPDALLLDLVPPRPTNP